MSESNTNVNAIPCNDSPSDAFTVQKSMAVKSSKTPKQALLVVVKAGIAKGLLLWWQVALLGWNAGVFIGFGGGLVVVVNGVLGSMAVTGTAPVYDDSLGAVGMGSVDMVVSVPGGVKKIVGGCLFPVGLMLVVLSGAELFTGNVMYVTAAALARKISILNLIKNWVWSYIGNVAGSLAVAYFVFHKAELIDDETKDYLLAVGASKTALGMWQTYFLRGIGCNFLVCLALWCASTADDIASKIIAIWWPIMAFVAIGFEHCVANMFFISLAMMEGLELTTGEFISRNLIPVTIGNIVGGLIFICVQYLIYHPYIPVDVKNMVLKQGGRYHPFARGAAGEAKTNAREQNDGIEFEQMSGPSSTEAINNRNNLVDHQVPTQNDTLFSEVALPTLVHKLAASGQQPEDIKREDPTVCVGESATSHVIESERNV